jgi:hypothetical protein
LPACLTEIPARGGIIFKNALEFDQLNPKMAVYQGEM